ncbi:ORF61 [Agrotis segetum granulovirus]|uniref:Ac38-like protein n=1 Tax=Agrotis segetum granulosis virus TaxID=10464 RepID=Q6QXP4_GVAS|nr:nudix [Agrotis segetum granulovirus]AAS82677.1 ORF61 [Agrotis segetum granulovirus]AHN92112.1 ac38-like protein [Agrotis segetum granulovirus]AKN63347.1 nudix [Agrotis segetum granulovirus]
MVKKGRHSGLLLITNDDKAVILQANKSYSERVNKNLKYNKHIPFVEKLSIPRGRQDVGEKDYETAVREFIEETGLIFDKVSIYKDPFLLEWQDESKIYRYTMYVAFLCGSLNSLRKKPNSYNIKLLKSYNYQYEVDLSKQRYGNNELKRKLDIMSLKKYTSYMENRQLPTYKYSNYNSFFNFVYKVKRLYESNDLINFFVILLYWYVDSETVSLNTFFEL